MQEYRSPETKTFSLGFFHDGERFCATISGIPHAARIGSADDLASPERLRAFLDNFGRRYGVYLYGVDVAGVPEEYGIRERLRMQHLLSQGDLGKAPKRFAASSSLVGVGVYSMVAREESARSNVYVLFVRADEKHLDVAVCDCHDGSCEVLWRLSRPLTAVTDLSAFDLHQIVVDALDNQGKGQPGGQTPAAGQDLHVYASCPDLRQAQLKAALDPVLGDDGLRGVGVRHLHWLRDEQALALAAAGAKVVGAALDGLGVGQRAKLLDLCSKGYVLRDEKGRELLNLTAQTAVPFASTAYLPAEFAYRQNFRLLEDGRDAGGIGSSREPDAFQGVAEVSLTVDASGSVRAVRRLVSQDGVLPVLAVPQNEATRGGSVELDLGEAAGIWGLKDGTYQAELLERPEEGAYTPVRLTHLSDGGRMVPLSGQAKLVYLRAHIAPDANKTMPLSQTAVRESWGQTKGAQAPRPAQKATEPVTKAIVVDQATDEVDIPWPGWKRVRKLGKGGFSSVWEIKRMIAGQEEHAAMKIIPVPSDADRGVVNGLVSSGYGELQIEAVINDCRDSVLNEYNFMRSVHGHSCVVDCDDVAWVPDADGMGGRVYIRMELLTSLRNQIKATRVIREDQVYDIGGAICDALDLCEKRGIVHRDIKPDNIMVSDDGIYKLGDFGIARVMDHAGYATRTGTPLYVAPEVYHGQEYDHTVDLYSLGLVLYWLLNDCRIPLLPRKGIPTLAMMERATQQRLDGKDLPAPAHGSAALQAVVLRACAYKPQDRYQRARDMAAALRQARVLCVEEAVRAEKAQAKPDLEPKPAPAKEKPEPKKQPAQEGLDATVVRPWAPFGQDVYGN